MTSNSYNCIVCSFQISKIGGDKDISSMYNDGVVGKLDANYGSKFDGDMYLFGICDRCIETKLSTGELKYIGNYMKPSY